MRSCLFYAHTHTHTIKSLVATVLKEKATSSSNIVIVLSVFSLLITLIGVVTTALLVKFLYNRHSRSRAYQVNEAAQWQPNGGTNVLQEEPTARPNGIRLRPPLLPLRQISTVSTRSYVSARSSATSFKWNLAYFLFKVLGSPGDTESPAVATGPNDQMPVTTLESTDQTERVDTNDSASTAGHIMVNVNRLDSPQYVNVNNYELVGSGTDHEDRISHRTTTTDFNKEEYWHVLS